ncbi:hypothetical protein BKA70DRAFT_1092941 [Coprinopsis sp. MPI-PUGE-AT-0042]|nr:hypothetical protein BKA70DRAFT_1092941 [Coprinopsis sp. MPI-PUGE-AT-0042]
MPVTFTVANHPANPVPAPYRPITDAEGVLKSTWGDRNDELRSKELLQSTFSNTDINFSNVVPTSNGFMRTVVQAYNQHHHLVLRPDDVWIAILCQFNFYVNAHAEELRKSFVAHEGKKKLVVYATGTRYTVDFGDLARQMTDLIDANVVDKELKEWILPSFSTTRHNDIVVSSVLMMSTLKAYFGYGFCLDCGIPSVTLEGERSDWVNLLNRIEKLDSFGDEPKAWAALLRPILSRFVSSFDGSPDIEFWNKICHYHSGGSGPDYLSGWITAFGVWSEEGKWQGPSLENTVKPYTPHGMYHLKLDDAQYGILDSDKVPAGYCEVDVELNDNGEKLNCMMVSGHIGKLTGGEKGDTLSPLSAWFMFIKEEIPEGERNRIDSVRTSIMPVTFTVASHPANPVPAPYRPIIDAEGVLKSTWGDKNHEIRSKELLQSTFSNTDTNFSNVVPTSNGFMRTVIQAYNQHHHLVLRPDDVWIAILCQFNFYVNAHAEELRKSFVAHEGKKKLVVYAIGTRYTVDFGDLARQMTDLIDANVVDKELKEWILPSFSTTRHNDVVVSSVLMMATLKAYFDYGFGICCGLPSVTLEGQRSDWVNLLNRIEKFETFGDEPKAWAGLLRPILSRFVSSFDGSPDIEFWNKICHYEAGGSGPSYLCGWITAFGVWSEKGQWQGPSLDKAVKPYTPHGTYRLKLDDAQYDILDSNDVPTGYCEVDVELDDNGEKFDCMMVSGHMGRLTGGEKGDTLSPLPAWFMFIKEEIPESERSRYY